ncbi:MAG: hypothetical protein WAS73_01995 [Defluviicoccus sp.]
MRWQSVIVRAPETFLNTVLWPEFQQINAALSDYLAQVTDKVIRIRRLRRCRHRHRQV